MKIFVKVLISILFLWVCYIAYLYYYGLKITILVLDKYEGPLLIIANQPDGIEFDNTNVIYDFTKTNTIKLKGDLVTGFSPSGYLKYYSVDSAGRKKEIKSISKQPNSFDKSDSEIFELGYYYQIGGCNNVKAQSRTNYELYIFSSLKNAEINLGKGEEIINRFCMSSD